MARWRWAMSRPRWPPRAPSCSCSSAASRCRPGSPACRSSPPATSVEQPPYTPRPTHRPNPRPAPAQERPMTVKYTEDQEWIRLDGDVGTVGITDHAQEQLGDVVFVELPAVGTQRSEEHTSAHQSLMRISYAVL